MAAVIPILSCVLLLATETLASCAYGTHLHRREEGAVDVNEFGYAGLIGPLNWVSLGPANILCATGSNQSPIDMVDGQFVLVAASDLGIDIPDFAEGTEFENLGTTVEVVAQGGTMTFSGVDFVLQQFHFHLPSEHFDAGVSHAMEMHMVWESGAGDIAVVGVYIDVDNSYGVEEVAVEPAETAVEETAVAEETATTEAAAEPTAAARKRSVRMAERDATVPAPKATASKKRAAMPLLETVFSSVGAIAEPGTVTTTEPLVMSELVDLINAGELQNYVGSLTTPPCSEDVTWFISTQRLQVTAASFGAVRDVIGFNARFPQNQLGQPNLLTVAAHTMASPHIQFAAIAQQVGVH